MPSPFFYEAPYGSETVQRLAPAAAKICVPPCISRRCGCKLGAAGFSFCGRWCIILPLKEGRLNLLLKENREKPLTVTVEYPRYDCSVERLVQGIRNLDEAVFGFEAESGARRGIIRISKSCLMNIAVLESVRRIANSRLEAVLRNGIRLIVSRAYLKGIRDYLASEGL